MKMIAAFAATAAVALSLGGCKYEDEKILPAIDLDELRASGDAWPDTREETFAVMDGFGEDIVRKMSWNYADFNTLTAFNENWSGVLGKMTRTELTGFLFCSCYCLSYNEGCRLNGIDKEAHVATGKVTLFGIDMYPRLAKAGIAPLPYIVYDDGTGVKRREVPLRRLRQIARSFTIHAADD